MTDAEATKLCAIAMGEQIRDDLSYLLHWHNSGWFMYDPLHDDALTMALVKKFDIYLEPYGGGAWLAKIPNHCSDLRLDCDDWHGSADNLNSAIVYCVASMQLSRSTKGV